MGESEAMNSGIKKEAESASRRLRMSEEKAGSLEAPDPTALLPEEARQARNELQAYKAECETQSEEICAGEIEASRTRYLDLYDLAPTGFVTVSEKGLIAEANLTAATLLCMVRGEMVRQPFTRFILPEENDIYYLHLKKLFETNMPQTCELRMVKEGGVIFWALLEATVVHDTDGASMCLIAMSDFTERKRAEENLEKSRTLLSEMTSQIPGVVYQFYARPNGEKGFHFISDKSEQIMGLKPDLEGYFERFTALIIPEHREGFIRSIEKSVNEVSEWKYEGMLQKPAGEKIWFSGHSTPLPRGNEMVFNGIVLDITDRRRMEDAVRESAENFRTFFDTMDDIIVVGDKDGKLMYANPSAAAKLG